MPLSHSHSHSTPLNISSAYSARNGSTSLSCGEDAGELVTWEPDMCSGHRQPPYLHEYYPKTDEKVISKLIDSESHHMPSPDYLRRCQERSVDVIARQDSINWILKVNACYHFSPVTAFLSVNYFDRFLSSRDLPPANGWPLQLLSVACLSLAAKMEEPQVPSLLELQTFHPRFIFEPKTIQRMELHVMAVLNWRLRSVTPFDYLRYFISKLTSCSTRLPDSFSLIVSAASDLILSTMRVIDFLQFAPSTVAAAAVLCATGNSFECPGGGAFLHENVNAVRNGEKLSPTNGRISHRHLSLRSIQGSKSRAAAASEPSRRARRGRLRQL
ncbi:cyclin-D1-1-like isoform X2 [Hibiscus syriacus]|uniref:cyclin-D1-1-like isoform X2 n=1 Tax=Hibiscus syriacus TaxID=106335 RepID=UPI001924A876|nr:cyclin-D1-1-like isoform X2 [Hibiscus syriacus]